MHEGLGAKTFKHASLKVKYFGKPYFPLQLSPEGDADIKAPWDQQEQKAEREIKQNGINVHPQCCKKHREICSLQLISEYLKSVFQQLWFIFSFLT